MQKNETKSTSARPRRKPLGELSKSLNNNTARSMDVGKWSLKTPTQENRLPSSETKMGMTTVIRNEAVEEDGGRDRLLMVQSDLSYLSHQVRQYSTAVWLFED